MLALIVIAAIAATGVWGVVAVLRARYMSQSQRMMAVGGIIVLMAALAAWVIFLWPAYLDEVGGAYLVFGPRGSTVSGRSLPVEVMHDRS